MKAIVYTEYGPPDVLQLKEVDNPTPKKDEVLVKVHVASINYITEVTGVCSRSKLDMVRSIGADQVIDYTQEDFTESEQRYDLIFDVAAYRSIFDYPRALNPEGIYLVAGGSMARFFQAMLLGPLISMTASKKLGTLGWAKPNKEDFAFMAELLKSGKVVPVIDRCYPLSEVPQALQYYGGGHTKGKVVITVEHNSNVGIESR